MPPWLQAIILGIVQGLTEFIPISSSGHLVIVPYLAGWPDPGLAFNVALHLGTALAVVVFFRRELVAMARGLLRGGRGGQDPDGAVYRRLAVFVVLATIPVGLAGVLLEDLVGEAFTNPLVAAAFLLLTAALLTLGEWRRDARINRAAAARPAPAADTPVWTGSWVGEASQAQAAPLGVLPMGDDAQDPDGAPLDRVRLRQALLIGLVQMVALLPGVSRSGATITAGMVAGLTREAATRFSFLLSLPALLGAFVVSLPDLAEPGPYSGAAIAGAVVAAFGAGYAAVRFLVALVARDRLTGFARYCVFVAVVTVIAYQFLGPPSSGV
jgi:undecaprenyl-diphosphatase